MEALLNAIELTGIVTESQQLLLDDILSITDPMRVRVIVLCSPNEEWNEKEWLHSASLSPALDFLKDPVEDIYLASDGKPYHDEV